MTLLCASPTNSLNIFFPLVEASNPKKVHTINAFPFVSLFLFLCLASVRITSCKSGAFVVVVVVVVVAVDVASAISMQTLTSKHAK